MLAHSNSSFFRISLASHVPRNKINKAIHTTNPSTQLNAKDNCCSVNKSPTLIVGTPVGSSVGSLVGGTLGVAVGGNEGALDGPRVGAPLGAAVGGNEGALDGAIVGAALGANDVITLTQALVSSCDVLKQLTKHLP